MTAPAATVFEDVLQRERLVLLSFLIIVIGLCWSWLLLGAGMDMGAMSMSGDHAVSGMAPAMMQPAVWTPEYAALMFVMWWVMMAAMMLLSAAPMLLLFARVNRGERGGGRSYVRPEFSQRAISLPGADSARSRHLRNGACSPSTCYRR
jgi:predicted metal-binding membrane protein